MRRYAAYLVVATLLVASLLAVSCSPQSSATEPSGSAPAEGAKEEGAPAAAQEAQYKIVWEDNGSPGSYAYQQMEVMRDKIVAACGGRLDLQLYPMDEIVKRGEIPQSVTERAIDMGSYGEPEDLPRIGNLAWLLCAVQLPGSPTAFEQMEWVYTGGGLEIERQILDPVCYLIGIRPSTAEVFCY
jgi:TRAP-type mannitol/chloroaromatic compound transport system substrate-binding protein